MSYIIPSKDLTIEQRANQRQRTQDVLVRRAVALALVSSKENASVRELLPSDLGLKDWVTPELLYGEAKTWLTHFISRSLIGIYKILQLSPDPGISQITFRRGYSGATLGIHSLESLYGQLPFWKLLANTVMPREVKEVMERLTDKPIKVLPDIADMEGYFSEPYIYDPEEAIQISLQASKHTLGDTIYLGGFVVEPLRATIV